MANRLAGNGEKPPGASRAVVARVVASRSGHTRSGHARSGRTRSGREEARTGTSAFVVELKIIKPVIGYLYTNKYDEIRRTPCMIHKNKIFKNRASCRRCIFNYE
jgi:hypothetical protein